MEEQVSVVTRNGQITIPAEIRRKLGIKEGDKVALRIEDDQVRLSRVESVVDRTAGSLKARQPAPPSERPRQIAEEAIAAESVERMGGE
ncbi:MAG TPA: AbrB/MazE/SpoVT family DNA-binding domain-containing protein [Nitrolancea sp.]|nr:AbrB/MazE/SpoVT family DNA-binding domain-containing protein [Nitrolancea sp.]